MSYVLCWRECLGGHLALGHRPGGRLREELERTGCTLVVNLLSEAESSAAPGERRLRIPLASAAPPDPSRDAEMWRAFARIRGTLEAGGKVYVHCSAGLHRTGMIAYAFLRSEGFEPAEAIARIRDMRELTATELTAERMAYGEGLVSRRP